MLHPPAYVDADAIKLCAGDVAVSGGVGQIHTRYYVWVDSTYLSKFKKVICIYRGVLANLHP